MLHENAVLLVAAPAAVAHAYFAYREMLTWNRGFVASVPPGWLEGTPAVSDGQIAWAGRLAFNMGAYNAMLAAGLAWVAIGGAALAPVAIFLALWLLVAAGAARRTGVDKAFVMQGMLGLLLLAAGLWSLSVVGPS